MKNTFLLAVPRLHASLGCMPDGCKTFWPGLPGKPDDGWQPDLPWQGASAAACLADFERAVRDGAKGAPVQALAAQLPPKDLSEAEIQALGELTGRPFHEQSGPLRQQAQQQLLLIWLKERQAMEMAALESDIAEKRNALASIMFGRKRLPQPDGLVTEELLPEWRGALWAMLAFLADMPEPCFFFINSAAMADEVEALPTHAAEPSACEGCDCMSLTAAALAGLCGGTAAKRLIAEMPPEQRERILHLIIPRKRKTA